MTSITLAVSSGFFDLISFIIHLPLLLIFKIFKFKKYKILKTHFPNQKIQYTSKEAFSPERGTLDTSNAKKILNYKSEFSIEKGYNLYIDWYKNFYSTLKE